MLLSVANAHGDISADVCVIGAGAAGITIARKLAARSIDVVLCEAGGLTYSSQSQAVYDGQVVGDSYFDLKEARLRYFGGSTDHWGGWCRALDPHDFASKSGCRLTEWPIAIDALAPYRAEAEEILELTMRPDEGPLDNSGLMRIGFGFSPPVRFRSKYLSELERSRFARVVLNANLTGMTVREGSVVAVRVRDYEDNERTIKAHYFILACGGIENSRLLLWLISSGQLPPGLSARHVGRYWMEHPHAPVGDVVIVRPERFVFDPMALDFFAPTPEFMARHKSLNCVLYLKSTRYGGAKEVIADLLCVAPTFGKWLVDRFNKQLACVAYLKASWEQEPRYENRVALGGKADRFGIPQSVLHWRRSALDRRTLRETVLAFAKYCARENIARVRLPDWLLSRQGRFPNIEEMAGCHHMGGTRMAQSPATGVVNADCRMFGTRNLYLAGSSVFPSGGYANPTFTIIQLSLRLADHLGDLIARRVLAKSP